MLDLNPCSAQCQLKLVDDNKIIFVVDVYSTVPVDDYMRDTPPIPLRDACDRRAMSRSATLTTKYSTNVKQKERRPLMIAETIFDRSDVVNQLVEHRPLVFIQLCFLILSPSFSSLYLRTLMLFFVVHSDFGAL